MKNIYIIIILFLSFTIFSCAKKSDSSSSTTSASYVSKIDNATASGSITVGSEALSGTYNSVCSSYPSDYPPSSTDSFGTSLTVTSNSSYVETLNYYSDSSCTSTDGYISFYYDNVTIGSAVDANYKSTTTITKLGLKPYTSSFKVHLDGMYYSNTSTTTVGSESAYSYGFSYFQLINVTATTAKLAKSTIDYPTSLGDTQELVK